MNNKWFSATLRFFIVNSAAGKMRAEDSVFLATAADFDDAFQRFLELGKQSETNYRNHQDEEIRRRFAAITTLDMVPASDLNGVEINSTPIFEADPHFTLDTPLDPAGSKPTQTI